ncbi:RND family efflux transporter, MFP subunit [Abditibacterium utsteinense]|uniref:RND family efflux transporter, MFP subunit n=1 Tax=Abditibacterium utsteinense TaxID=1960156 RepID=A0A2S8SPH2_9BACT|nr:efflux RND transporter periplasmic adaptor subunit [Abditibacterium utsteinense]PQV62688.1 RND family efflux transporter, MFP subunit [Abditibacterium utsteinense]
MSEPSFPFQKSLSPQLATGARVKITRAAFAPLLLVALGTSLAGCGAPQSPEISQGSEPEKVAEIASSGGAQTIAFEGESAQIAGIALSTVALSPQSATLSFPGIIEASPGRVVRVASVVPGRVTRLFATIGARVRQGQVLAVVESRAVGEAQSAYAQALARLNTARSNQRLIESQARAGVFSRAPLETARGRLNEAQAEVRAQQVARRGALSGLDNARRLAGAGSFASPAIEAARAQKAGATETLKTAQAALSQASSQVISARAELARRRELAQNGGYTSRAVAEATRLLVAAQSARATSQSEVSTTQANLNRLKTLSGEGLVSQRDVENAQTASETAKSRLESAASDEKTAAQELERQKSLAGSNVNAIAEVRAAQSLLATAQASVQTRLAEIERARSGARLADVALTRESRVLSGGVANRRELSAAQNAVSSAKNALRGARESVRLAQSGFERENRIFRQNLNTNAQLQGARAQVVGAQAELRAAQTALQLFKSSPNGSASIPIRAPISGIVTEREVAQGEVLDADAQILTLVDNSVVHADFYVPEREVGRLKVGQMVTVQSDAVPGRRFTERIELIHTQLDPKTRTVEAHAEIPNPDGAIKIGISTRNSVQTGSGNMSVSLPEEAVQEMEGKRVVFIPGAQKNTFEAREVGVGPTRNGRVAILSGIVPGQKYVSKGAFMVKAQAMKSELAEE